MLYCDRIIRAFRESYSLLKFLFENFAGSSVEIGAKESD